MWRDLRRPTCQLRLRWRHFCLKLANGLEIRGQREQLTALTVLVLAYLAAPPPPVTPATRRGELLPVGESLPVPHRYALELGGLAPAIQVTLQELYDLAWVLEAAQTPRFPWWQQALGWLALGLGLALALGLAWLPRPVQWLVVTRTIPRPPSPQALPSPPPTPPSGTTIALDTVSSLPPPPVTPSPTSPALPKNDTPKPSPQSVAPPELHGIERYFRQRWQPPPTLEQPLSYRLVITRQGTLSRITPLSPEAGVFLDQTPMPLVGETFTGAIPQTAKVQLVLEPDGQVRVWFEGWDESS